jgi:hypothetical protein
MDNKEAVAVIRSNWPDSKYSMLREALELSIKSLESAELAQQSNNSDYATALRVLEEHRDFYDDHEPRLCFANWLQKRLNATKA